MPIRELKLSFSADSDFQACQWRYFLSYIYGITADKDKDSLRVGEAWHRCHEILEMVPQSKCPDCLRHEEIRPGCDLCAGIGYLPQDMMDAVARYLNRIYSVVPDGKTREDWEAERVGLLYSLSGHRWLYGSEQRFDVVGSEIKCVIPVVDPNTGRKLPKVKFVLKVDKLVRDRTTGLVYVWERKSTSHPITEADYWSGLTQGDQITGYLYGIRVAQYSGQLAKYGIKPSDPPVAGAFCDVWHKPDIKPKLLSQGDTADFIASGEYCGEKFEIHLPEGEASPVYVNGVPAQVTPGKKDGTFAIRETPEMFGARLLADIAERPEHYFAQREVSRTDQQLEAFQLHLFKVAKQVRYVEGRGLWCKNLKSCSVPFWCEFKGLCESNRDIDPSDPFSVSLQHKIHGEDGADVIPSGYVNKYASKAEVEVQL